ncbi:MAG TPA: hypothetical protein VNO30_29215 [Kofleriaceae bacterium]|nr:hypothetical protein [Kofleriaceae bacterium]
MKGKQAAISALACGALAGCSLITDSFRENDFSGDPYPIQIGRESGAVLIGVRKLGGREPDKTTRVGVLDVLSPLTLTDPGLGKDPTIGTTDLLLLGRAAPGDEEFALPRAQLRGPDVISLHPCLKSEPACLVGGLDPGASLPYNAIIGANALAGDALRLRLGDDQVFLLADVGGDDRDRTLACDAVFPSPYRGGGTLVVASTEVSFGGRRVTLQACLGADPDQPTQTARGGDALLVASTGIGVSLLGETAYERYRQAALLRGIAPQPLAFMDLPAASAYLPSGLVEGRRATIDRLALAAASSSSPRAPCRQVFTHHRVLADGCTGEADCPCGSKDPFCSVPAVVELTPATGLEVLVVPANNATLQALRAELRPDQPEVDGILGADALALAEIDVDYPHNRVLARCSDPAAPAKCVTRPALAEKDDIDRVGRCLGLPQL